MFKVKEKNDNISIEQFMYQLIHDKRAKESFPNVEMALRIYLVLMITNCSAERSVSKLKLTKNRLRMSMSHDRLSNMAVMSIKQDILREVDFADVIDEFASRKERKVSIN